MGLPTARRSDHFRLDHPMSAEEQLDQLTTGAPGRGPDLADQAVQAAAAEGRMRIGMGRAATFLTGLGRSESTQGRTGGTSSSGSKNLFSGTRTSGLDLRRLRVAVRSNPGGSFDGL